MTKAQIELLIQLAITVRSLAPPDDYEAIQDCLRALSREAESEMAEYVIQSKGILIP